jgi:hypothetical protein
MERWQALMNERGFRNADPQWVQQTIERLQSAAGTSGGSLGELLIDEALHANLADVCPQGTLAPLLPDLTIELTGIEQATLPAGPGSRHVLQLDSVLDISVPLYCPKIEVPEKPPREEEVSGTGTRAVAASSKPAAKPGAAAGSSKQTDYNRRRRTLRLVFSDGRRSLVALELEENPAFDDELHHGMKYALQGPVSVRHGMALITRDSLQRLGGFVCRAPTAL